MYIKTPEEELSSRMLRFRQSMDRYHKDWKAAVIFSKINLLYFTGSMPDGMLIVERGGNSILWTRRSYERACDESMFTDIRPMSSYKDAAVHYSQMNGDVFLETEFVPLAMYQRFQKYFSFSGFKSLDYAMAMTRAVKSQWELDFMIQSGKIHQRVLEEKVPQLLREGMSEASLAGELFQVMVEEGHQGIARFNMFDTEIAVGQIAFGENSLYPTNFNGPGGQRGVSPAVPVLGSRDRKLKKGDLVFVDIGMGVNGYHTDKTMTYMFGSDISSEAIDIHRKCVELQNRIAEMLRPGAIPSNIYETIMEGLDSEFLRNFMGFGSRQVKFLGHGIGLTVDELPVLAKGFDEPLEENMVFAVEPKKGVAGVGAVGTENSFIVTPQGGCSITGDHPGLLRVG